MIVGGAVGEIATFLEENSLSSEDIQLIVHHVRFGRLTYKELRERYPTKPHVATLVVRIRNLPAWEVLGLNTTVVRREHAKLYAPKYVAPGRQTTL